MTLLLNDMGVDPNEWFDDRFVNPLDSMPIATNGDNRHHPDKEVGDWYDNAPCEYEPPMQESDWFIEKPIKSEKVEEEEKTIHQKMYEIATSRYNPFSVGGSENCNSDIECNIGGSENASKK